MNYAKLRKTLNIQIQDQMLDKCFIYPGNERKNNEFFPLACLGDKVLGDISMRYIYRKYPGSSEHDLTTKLEAIVSNNVICQFSEKLGFVDVLKVDQNCKVTDEMLANVFEAFCGICELNNNFTALENIIKKLIDEKFTLLDKFKNTSEDEMHLRLKKAGYSMFTFENKSKRKIKSIEYTTIVLTLSYKEKDIQYTGLGIDFDSAKKDAYYRAYSQMMLNDYYVKPLNLIPTLDNDKGHELLSELRLSDNNLYQKFLELVCTNDNPKIEELSKNDLKKRLKKLGYKSQTLKSVSEKGVMYRVVQFESSTDKYLHKSTLNSTEDCFIEGAKVLLNKIQDSEILVDEDSLPKDEYKRINNLILQAKNQTLKSGKTKQGNYCSQLIVGNKIVIETTGSTGKIANSNLFIEYKKQYLTK